MNITRVVSIGVQMQNPQPVGSLLTYQARLKPDAPAYTINGKTTTYAELESRSNRRARVFSQNGVREGDFVSIALPNGLESHETVFALWKLGAIPAPVSHKLPDNELRAIVELVKPRLMVGIDASKGCGVPSLAMGFEPDTDISDDPLPECAPKYLKATTSGGSTGRPKVIVDHKPGLMDPDFTILGMSNNDTILNPAPLYHNAPFGFTNMALCLGAHVVEMPRFDPAAMLSLIETYKVKWLYLVPTMMNRIMLLPEEERCKYDISSVELMVHMAAACPIWLKQKWIDWLSPEKVWEVYAGTEGVGGTIIAGNEWVKHKGSVGKVDSDSVRIIGGDGRNALAREVGEIYFRPKHGIGSTYHYIGAAPKVVEDWESYGDMGWLDEDGYLYLADRRTDMIISGGANIFPAEIEAVLDSHDAIGSSVVVGLPDDDLGHRGHAIIELLPGKDAPSPTDLDSFLSSRIARYKIPYTYEWVDGSLRDDAGKVRRSALRDIRIEQFRNGHVFMALRGL